MFRRFQRLEHKRTVTIETATVHSVYRQMTSDLYGGGDTGAYEEDALNRSRSVDTCLHDSKNRPLLIDGYSRIDPKDLDAVRLAIAMASGKGIAICFNLPTAIWTMDDSGTWDIPAGQQLIDDWLPGSAGGHSMWAIDYNKKGLIVEQTWEIPEQLVTWEFVSAYMDEAHSVIDSVDSWKRVKGFDLKGFVSAVNDVSRTKIAI